MKFSALQIAQYLGGTVEGDSSVQLSDFSKIEEGKAGSLTFLANPKYTHYIYTTQASACLVTNDFVPEQPLSLTLIRVDNPYECLAKLMTLAQSMLSKPKGIDKAARIDKSAKVGKDVYVAPFAYIGKNVKVGDRCVIEPHVFVGDNVVLGDDVYLYAGAKICPDCVIGDRTIVHTGAVIGADGFGFAPNKEGGYDKIPQLGNVIIEQDVEIGANTTIDRATMGSTIVHRGVKIDNLVQIAHNVEIGANTVIAAQVGIAGSAKIGQHCMLGGQVGVAGHITIADGSIVAAQAGVASSIKEPNKAWQGSPAMPINTFRRVAIIERMAPDLLRRFEAVEKKIKG